MLTECSPLTLDRLTACDNADSNDFGECGESVSILELPSGGGIYIPSLVSTQEDRDSPHSPCMPEG